MSVEPSREWTITCDGGCGSEIVEGYSPVPDSFYCEFCFQKRIEKWTRKNGRAPRTLSDYKDVFFKGVKVVQSKVI